MSNENEKEWQQHAFEPFIFEVELENSVIVQFSTTDYKKYNWRFVACNADGLMTKGLSGWSDVKPIAKLLDDIFSISEAFRTEESGYGYIEVQIDIMQQIICKFANNQDENRKATLAEIKNIMRYALEDK